MTRPRGDTLVKSSCHWIREGRHWHLIPGCDSVAYATDRAKPWLFCTCDPPAAPSLAVRRYEDKLAREREDALNAQWEATKRADAEREAERISQAEIRAATAAILGPSHKLRLTGDAGDSLDRRGVNG